MSKQLLGEWSALEVAWSRERVVAEDLYSILTFELLHSLHPGVPRVLEICVAGFFVFERDFEPAEGLL